MKILIAALLLVLLVAGCVGQSAQQPTGGAMTSDLDSSLQGITDDLNDMNTDSSDLSTPGVDLTVP